MSDTFNHELDAFESYESHQGFSPEDIINLYSNENNQEGAQSWENQ